MVLNTALPLLAQGDENVTVWADVTGTPPLLTVTVILVVPNAESGVLPTPKTGVEIVTLATPTDKPIEPVTAELPTMAFAVIVVAPAMAPPAIVIVATPAEFVSAVPEDGVMVPILALARTYVTTALGTAMPAASFTVAFTRAEVPLEIEVTVAPVTGSESAKVKLGAATKGGVPPVPLVPGVVVPAVVPEVQLTKTAIVMANKNAVKNLVIF